MEEEKVCPGCCHKIEQDRRAGQGDQENGRK